MDPVALAAVLAADYPLLDPPLIIALVSDYEPASIASHIEEIRDQLGVLQASMVPDVEETVTDFELAPPAAESEDHMSESLSSLRISTSPETSGESSKKWRGWSNGTSGEPSHPGSGMEGSGLSASSEPSTTATSALGEDEHLSSLQDDEAELQLLFPDLSKRVLREVLQHESGVEAAIEHLLSIEFIREVERHGSWPDDDDDNLSDHLYSEDWHLVERRGSRSPEKKPGALDEREAFAQRFEANGKKSKRKDKRTIPLVDTLQRKPTPVQSRTTSRAQSPSRNRYRDFDAPAQDAWDSLSSLAAYLHDCLPRHPPSYFLSYLHSPNHASRYAAIRSSLFHITTSGMVADDPAAKTILYDIYNVSAADHTSLATVEQKEVRADLEACVNAAGWDVGVVMDLMDLLAEVSAWRLEDELNHPDVSDPLDLPGSSSAPSSPVLQSSPLAPHHPHPQLPSSSRTKKATFKTERLTTRPGKGAIVSVMPKDRKIPGFVPTSDGVVAHAHDEFGVPVTLPLDSAIPMRKTRSSDSRPQVHPQNFRVVHHARQKQSRAQHPYASFIPAYARNALPNDPTPGALGFGNGVSTSAYSIDECLTKAQTERYRRETAIREAGRHYRGTHLAGGKAVNGAVAGHYAAQAREAADKAKEWEMRAARMYVEGQLNRTRHTIDLHHLTVAEATTLSLESTERWFAAAQAAEYGGRAASSNVKQVGFVPSQPLTIVTGIGRHSAGQKGVLGPAVAAALQRAGWRVQSGDGDRGYLTVTGKRL